MNFIRILVLPVAAAMLAVPAVQAQIKAADVVCTYGAQYKFRWDGHTGTLILDTSATTTGTGRLTAWGTTYHVRYQILTEPQVWIEGYQGPGYRGWPSSLHHRIVMWIDFGKTPWNTQDDQRFDGYFFTQSRDAMAGVTWWQNIPFGFYASDKGCIPG